jgi:hypothetical protein
MKLGGFNLKDGRAVTQVVRCWLLIAKPWVHSLVMRFMVDEVALKQVFSECLRFYPPNHYSAIALTKQHIITSSSVTRCLAEEVKFISFYSLKYMFSYIYIYIAGIYKIKYQHIFDHVFDKIHYTIKTINLNKDNKENLQTD